MGAVNSDVEDVKLLLDHARDVTRDISRVGLHDMAVCIAAAAERNNSDILRALTPFLPQYVRHGDFQSLLAGLRYLAQAPSSSTAETQLQETAAAMIERD